MGSFWGLSVQLVTFREQGILRRFRVAPIGASAMLASSIISNYFLTIPTVVIEFIFAPSLSHVQYGQSLGSVCADYTWDCHVCDTRAGYRQRHEHDAGNPDYQPDYLVCFLFLSGVTVPLPILPKLVQKVSYFLPATYLVSGLQQSMVDHAGISDLGLDLASMLGCTVIAFLVSTQLFRWEPEAKAPRRAQALGRCRGDPFPLAGVWENKPRPCAHPRSDGFSVHGAFVSPGNASPLTRERFYESM